MVNRISIALLALLLSSISLLASANQLDARKVNTQLSPATVSSVPGQWTLVQLWTLDCVVCEKQKPALSQLNEDYEEARLIPNTLALQPIFCTRLLAKSLQFNLDRLILKNCQSSLN